MNYYNTTHLSDEDLLKEIANAKGQDEKILIYFKNHQANYFTPSEILEKVFENSVPITSVRRSITNLTDGKRLVKTFKQKKGLYGKLNYCWKYNVFYGLQEI